MGEVRRFDDSFNVTISGSRDYDSFWEFAHVLDDILHLRRNRTRIRLFEGGARGVDKLAAKYAVLRKIRSKRFHADWDSFPRQAGILRNIEMIDQSDMVVAFWDGASKGTKHAIDYGLKKRKRVIIVRTDLRMKIIEVTANGGYENARMNDMFRNYEWFRLREFLDEDFKEAA